jgi:hypothetical protein
MEVNALQLSFVEPNMNMVSYLFPIPLPIYNDDLSAFGSMYCLQPPDYHSGTRLVAGFL